MPAYHPQRIEPKWQAEWERNKTFRAVDLDPDTAQALRPRHVPLSERGRAARRPSRGLHRDRYPLPIQADAGIQRPAPDGLGCLRPARRAIRRREQRPPADHDPAEHRQLPPADQVARVLLRLGPRDRYDRSRLLQVDPVDLPADLRHLVRPRLRVDRRHGPSPTRQGPADRRAADPARHDRPRRLSRFPTPGLSGRGPRQLVSRAGHGAGQRRSHRRQERARRLSRSSACR